MKMNTKSSVTLPAEELELVNTLRKQLGLKSKVEVVRRGLRLLKETTDRDALRSAYEKAAAQVRDVTAQELDALDHLVAEGLE